MWIALFTLLSIVVLFYSGKFLYKWSGGGGEIKEIVDSPGKIKPEKIRKYLTVDFKVKKKILDGDPVKPYPVPDSNAVNFYEKDSYGGDGFIHKEYNKTLWSIIEDNRDVSATIVRTGKNEAYIKVMYK